MADSYFKNIADGIRTTLKGLGLTAGHLWAARKRRMPGDIRKDTFFGQTEGMVTIQYPLETIPIPDNGRYRLHNEMDDCIVCDKCAKVCPVDCIEIEPIRAIEEVGKASDGSPIRLYAAKFDIDMAKCCYCGLCTTVCPTECLTMTRTFDYSEFDVRDMVYEYGNLTPAEADEKKQLLEQFQKEKEALKAAAQAVPKPEPTAKPASPRPAFRPTKPPVAIPPGSDETVEPTAEKQESPVKKSGPPFRPSMKPRTDKAPETEGPAAEVPSTPKPKPVFKPSMKPASGASSPKPDAADQPQESGVPAERPKPAFRPTMKPTDKAVSAEATGKVEPTTMEGTEKQKTVFKPTMKPAAKPVQTEEKINSPSQAEKPLAELKPKPAFRPTMKPRGGPAKPAEE
ncbi:4Fe-4S binding protein [Salmonirosea aquatica]|uniref:4Fe-4S dicluster domain-containing protein n=1 Tax=Salmonirosea aquatica TaxID=2654236 RepID=A0A7C9FD00_9BACT|nr:4Fe-4S dicluster domain-containing protein [Cytophagaceae bacterium SJW1-29]